MTDSQVDKQSGLTEDERAILQLLVDARQKYIKLPQSLYYAESFSRGVEACIDVLKSRVVERDYPGFWR